MPERVRGTLSARRHPEIQAQVIARSLRPERDPGDPSPRGSPGCEHCRVARRPGIAVSCGTRFWSSFFSFHRLAAGTRPSPATPTGARSTFWRRSAASRFRPVRPCLSRGRAGYRVRPPAVPSQAARRRPIRGLHPKRWSSRKTVPARNTETRRTFLSALREMTIAEVQGNVLILSDETGREMVFRAGAGG